MGANIREVWTVHETLDEYGRKGRLIGRFTKEVKAIAAARGRGWYGGEASIEYERVGLIDGRWYPLASTAPVPFDADLIEREEELRRSGLAKLSAEERRALFGA